MTLAPLLNDTIEAAYWVGFIFADGCFTGYKNSRLQIELSGKDSKHLEKCALFLSGNARVSTENGYEKAYFAMMDVIHAESIKRKFDLRPRKTYNPPSVLPYKDLSLLKAFLLGFIDGDGHIAYQTGRRSAKITTISHASWKAFLLLLTEALNLGVVADQFNGTDWFVAWGCYKHEEIVALKYWAKIHDLPIMDRKWSRVDETYVTRTVGAAKLKAMISEGKSNLEIYTALGTKPSALSNARRRLAERKGDLCG